MCGGLETSTSASRRSGYKDAPFPDVLSKAATRRCRIRSRPASACTGRGRGRGRRAAFGSLGAEARRAIGGGWLLVFLLLLFFFLLLLFLLFVVDMSEAA